MLRVLTAILLLASAVSANEFSYYYQGTPISLLPDSTVLLVKFDDTLSTEQWDQLLREVPEIDGMVSNSQAISGFLLCSLRATVDYSSIVESVRLKPGIARAEPVFLDYQRNRILVGESFCAKFSDSTTPAQIDSINRERKVEICGRSIASEKTVYLRSLNSDESVLDLANRYWELRETDFAYPNFFMAKYLDSYRTYDYYQSYQWQMRRIVGEFGVRSVWDFAGLQREVRIALIDEGIVSHEDIPGSRVEPGFDFFEWYSDGSPGDSSWHGMACAGILGAAHTTDSILGLGTGSGVIGINPWCKILSIKIFPDDPHGCGLIPESVFVNGMDYAWLQDVDVVSCSWHMPLPSDGMEDAIHRVVSNNKSYRGAPVIFSSGNTVKLPAGPVNFPARLPDCLAVGAVDSFDVRFSYSNYDSTLDLVAPSAANDMWSLDQMGLKGGNNAYMTCPPGADNIDFVCQFWGTSAACPQVAAVASLVRARDSMLTYEEIYQILKMSAVSLGLNPPNYEYGYGRVDAFRAVLSISHGDVNNDGFAADLSDLSALIAYTTNPSAKPFPSLLLADWNCSGGRNPVDLTDLSLCIAWVTGSPNRVPPVKPCFKF